MDILSGSSYLKKMGQYIDTFLNISFTTQITRTCLFTVFAQKEAEYTI